jgi:hypothetical protein
MGCNLSFKLLSFTLARKDFRESILNPLPTSGEKALFKLAKEPRKASFWANTVNWSNRSIPLILF